MAEGEDEEEEEAGKEKGDEEFEDKEHESQFCLETNFSGEGEQEEPQSTREHHDRKGKEKFPVGFNNTLYSSFSNTTSLLVNFQTSLGYCGVTTVCCTVFVLSVQTCSSSIWT